MERVDEKSVILIGPDNIGKRNFVNSLELLSVMSLNANIQNDKRKPFYNLKGELSDQEFEVLIPSYSKSYNVIKLKIVICRSIKFGNMEENMESIRCLTDYKYEFNSIFYFTDGRDNRILDYNKMCLTNLLSIFGESLVEFITIIQSFSNLIEDKMYGYEISDDLESITRKKAEIDKFHKDRTFIRRMQFYELLKSITSKINDRFPCNDFARFQEIALSKVAYVEFGEVKLVKEKKEVEEKYVMFRSSIPYYSKDFLNKYELNFPGKEIENYDWIEIFMERINSLKNTFSFKKIDEQMKEIKKLSEEKMENLKIDERSFQKAVSILDDSEKTDWLQSTLRNMLAGTQVAVNQFNSLNNLSLLTSLSQGNGFEIIESLKTINEYWHNTDNEVKRFNELMAVFEQTKKMEMLKKQYKKQYGVEM